MNRPIVVMCIMLVPLMGHAAEEGPQALCAQGVGGSDPTRARLPVECRNHGLVDVERQIAEDDLWPKVLLHMGEADERSSLRH